MDDPAWFRAELDGRSGLIPSNYIEMQPHPSVSEINQAFFCFVCSLPHLFLLCRWFHGKISRLAADTALMNCSVEGAFLFRESESSPGASWIIRTMGIKYLIVSPF